MASRVVGGPGPRARRYEEEDFIDEVAALDDRDEDFRTCTERGVECPYAHLEECLGLAPREPSRALLGPLAASPHRWYAAGFSPLPEAAQVLP